MSVLNYYFPNDVHDWILNKSCATHSGGVVPSVSLKPSVGDVVNIVPFSDIHIGAVSFNKDLFQSYLALINELNAYVVLNGDVLEVAIPSRIEQSVWEIDMTTDEQYVAALRYFLPIRDRILFITSGNHDARVWKKTGFDIAKNLAKDLGSFYNKNGGYFRVNAGTQTYTFSFFHGHSAAQNPYTELDRRLVVYDDSDIICMGNNHFLGYKTMVKKRIDAANQEVRDFVYIIRTGGFLSEPEYSREALYAPTLEGAPVISLGTKQRKISVDVSGENRW